MIVNKQEQKYGEITYICQQEKASARPKSNNCLLCNKREIGDYYEHLQSDEHLSNL